VRPEHPRQLPFETGEVFLCGPKRLPPPAGSRRIAARSSQHAVQALPEGIEFRHPAGHGLFLFPGRQRAVPEIRRQRLELGNEFSHGRRRSPGGTQ